MGHVFLKVGNLSVAVHIDGSRNERAGVIQTSVRNACGLKRAAFYKVDVES
jgi:hypothetical protein